MLISILLKGRHSGRGFGTEQTDLQENKKQNKVAAFHFLAAGSIGTSKSSVIAVGLLVFMGRYWAALGPSIQL